MSRRGLTLIEVLIAIALAVAFLAIAFPALTGALDRRAFDGASDSTLHQLLLARAHAQTTGRPVEVIYHPARRAVEARRFDPAAAAVAPGDDPERDGTFADTGGALDIGSTDEIDRRIPEGWATQVLPSRLRFTDEPPGDERLPAEALADAPRPAPPLRAADPRPLRITVFMPDGSALLGRELWLVDERGRAASLTVNPWTGLPRFAAPAAAPLEPRATPEDEEALADEPAFEDDWDQWPEDEAPRPVDDDPPPDNEEDDDDEDEEADAPAGGPGGAP